MSAYAPTDREDPENDPLHPDYRPTVGGVPPTSGTAVASLVCGLLFCVPFVTSALAVAFGMVGMRRTRYGQAQGRGFAVAGLVLGVSGIGLWLVFGAIFLNLAQGMLADQERAQSAAGAFLQDLSDRKVDAALVRVAAGAGSDLDRAHLAEISQGMKDWGPFNEIADFGRPEQNPAVPFEIRRWEFDGDAVFSRARKPVNIRVSKDGGAYKVDRFGFK